MYISVVGNIGAGKTTLTRMLAQHFKWTPNYESVENNPYLDDFYKDMARWSFNLQVYFLQKRLKDVLNKSSNGEVVIQDRCVEEDRYIFSQTLCEQGKLSNDDLKTYEDLYEFVTPLVEQPSLIVYIRSSIGNLVSQIEKRNRGCESQMSIEYLSSLNKKYENWISNYKGNLLIIDGDTCKFETDNKAFNDIINQIKQKLSLI